jgi:hypothetical protein
LSLINYQQQPPIPTQSYTISSIILTIYLQITISKLEKLGTFSGSVNTSVVQTAAEYNTIDLEYSQPFIFGITSPQQ